MSEGGKDKELGWWQSWRQDALTFVPRDHSIGEAILGIGKLIEEGKSAEAREYARLARVQIEILRTNPKMTGELGNSQLAAMLASDRFPESLKSEIFLQVPELKSYLPKIADTLSRVAT